MASIYKRGKIYQIKFHINVTAYQKSLKTKNKTRAEYLKKEIEKYEEIDSYPSLDEIISGNSLQNYNIEKFLDFIEKQNSENISIYKSTRKRNNDYIHNFQRFLKENNIKYFYQIKPSTAIDYRNWRLNTPAQRIGNTISASTIKKELSYIKNSIFEIAIDEEILTKNPFKNATKGLKVYDKEARPFTKNEVEKLIENAPNQLHRDIYITALLTGGRLGEISHLEWSEVDLEEKILAFMNKASHKTKTRKSRIVPIHPILLKVLKRRKKTTQGNYVFPSRKNPNKPLTSIRTTFNELKKKLGISPEKSLHSFRHSFASNLQDVEIPLEASKELMGHTDIRMTAHYQKASIELKRKAISKLMFDIDIEID